MKKRSAATESTFLSVATVMNGDPYEEVYQIHRRLLINERMFALKEASISPQVEQFDEEATEFIVALYQSTSTIWIIKQNLKEDPSKLLDKMNAIHADVKDKETSPLILQILATIPSVKEQIYHSAASIPEIAFNSIPAVFQYLWSSEQTQQFLDLLFSAPPDSFSALVESLVAHPLVCSFFKAGIQPVFEQITSMSATESLELMKKSLLSVSPLIPNILRDVINHAPSPTSIFWGPILSVYLTFPSVFGFCGIDFLLFHSQILKQLIQLSESFFTGKEGDDYVKSLVLSHSSAVLYPSASLLESVTGKRTEKMLISERERGFLKSILDFHLPNSDIILIKPPPIPPPPSPLHLVPQFVDRVISILLKCRLIHPKDVDPAPFSILQQIVELNSSITGENVEDAFDSIATDLKRITIKDLCSQIAERLTSMEIENNNLVLKTIAKYSSQAELIRMHTKAATSIYTNGLLFGSYQEISTKVNEIWNSTLKLPAFDPSDSTQLQNHFSSLSKEISEKTGIRLDIEHSRIVASILLYKFGALQFFSLSTESKELDSLVLKVMERPPIEFLVKPDSFLIKCAQSPGITSFFTEHILRMSQSQSPFQLANCISVAMGWLNSYVLNEMGEGAGADCIIPMTILALSFAKPAFLASLSFFFEQFVMPLHQSSPLFEHSEFYFITTFFVASEFFVDKAKILHEAKKEKPADQVLTTLKI